MTRARLIARSTETAVPSASCASYCCGRHAAAGNDRLGTRRQILISTILLLWGSSYRCALVAVALPADVPSLKDRGDAAAVGLKAPLHRIAALQRVRAQLRCTVTG